MAASVQLSGIRIFQLRHQSSTSPLSKTLAPRLSSSSAFFLHVSSSPTVLQASRRHRRKVFIRSTVSGTPFVSESIAKLSETELVFIPSVHEGIEGQFPSGAGVYGVYDKEGDLQFIGISRNVAASISTHSKMVPDLCHSVKVGLVDGDNPDKTVLTNAWKSWLQEHLDISGKIPPGESKREQHVGSKTSEQTQSPVDPWPPCPAVSFARRADRSPGQGERSGCIHQGVEKLSPMRFFAEGCQHTGVPRCEF
ncbi:hypothetical protein KSP40_PGU018592 [Platanthera guangdongensis]|uniref:Uncharacterized protein n=1 Tax=Platanthera guangdongensis TaxID=2320717 RepID=A0ABR2LUS3_9ASPA